MPKSIFEVDVDDTRFKEFSGVFDKYQKTLAAQPRMWKATQAGANEAFDVMIAAMLTQLQLQQRMQEAGKRQLQNTKESASYWKMISGNTKDVANNLYRATQSLVRWAGLATELGGLLGIGGLWGLDRLAGSVGSGRRQSQGLGLDTGSRQAFGINYGRVVDPNSFLSGVGEALHDPASRWKLYAAGLTPDQMKGDTGDTAVALMDKYKQLADHTDKSMLGAVLKARGGMISLEDFTRLKSLSADEYGGIRSNYMNDRKNGLSDKTQQHWQDFNAQLDRAGIKIRNALVDGLTPLTPSLEHLSNVATDLVTKFFSWAKDSHAIDKMAGSLEEFANYLGSKDFHDKLKTFAQDVVALGSAIHTGLEKLGLVPESEATKNSPEGRLRSADPNSKGNTAQRLKSGLQSDSAETFGPWHGLLEGIRHAESGNTNGFYQKDIYDKSGKLIHHKGAVVTSSAGARGAYQFMPATAKDYGINPDDPAQAKHGAALMLGDLGNKYGGDVVKMLAAYNWGQGNVDHALKGYTDKDGKKHAGYGDDWYKHIPKETGDYVRKVLRDGVDPLKSAVRSPAYADPRVRIEIMNFTGSDLVTTTGQVAR